MSMSNDALEALMGAVYLDTITADLACPAGRASECLDDRIDVGL